MRELFIISLPFLVAAIICYYYVRAERRLRSSTEARELRRAADRFSPGAPGEGNTAA